MARDSGVPILPICLKGSRQIVPTQGWKTYFDNTVQVIFKPLIQTAGRSLEDVMADVRLAVDPML
jgi:1-acyl-sn-glycerol-3-phosphate acyltransferase